MIINHSCKITKFSFRNVVGIRITFLNRKVYVDIYRVLGTCTSIQTARFSNTKLLHLIDHNREAARVIPAGTMLFGTTNKVVKTDWFAIF